MQIWGDVINTCCEGSACLAGGCYHKHLLIIELEGWFYVFKQCREIIVRSGNETENYFLDYRINICVSISLLPVDQNKANLK